MPSNAISTIIAMIESLPPATQEQLVEYLHEYIAQLEGKLKTEAQNTTKEVTQSNMSGTELSHNVTDILNPNMDYPIWSPYDSYEAAHKLAQMLEEHKKAK